MHCGEITPCDEPGGWPEFRMTIAYYVTSDDPEKLEAARQRVFDHVSNTLADDLSTAVVSSPDPDPTDANLGDA